jgi:cell division protein FtsL
VKSLANPLLLLLVVISAMSAVYARLFVELQALEAERDDMNVEWGQLQLEQSTFTTHGQVEDGARKRLGMRIPVPEQVMILRP